MKYEVIIEYMHFQFNDSVSATTFAEVAIKNYKPHRDDDSDIEVKILLLKED